MRGSISDPLANSREAKLKVKPMDHEELVQENKALRMQAKELRESIDAINRNTRAEITRLTEELKAARERIAELESLRKGAE